MGILEDLRDGKPCRWTGVCDEMSAVGGCTCGEAADEIERLRKEIHEYDDMIRDAGWYLTDDGGNSYKNADEIISHFLLAKDKARAEQNAALKENS